MNRPLEKWSPDGSCNPPVLSRVARGSQNPGVNARRPIQRRIRRARVYSAVTAPVPKDRIPDMTGLRRETSVRVRVLAALEAYHRIDRRTFAGSLPRARTGGQGTSNTPRPRGRCAPPARVDAPTPAPELACGTDKRMPRFSPEPPRLSVRCDKLNAESARGHDHVALQLIAVLLKTGFYVSQAGRAESQVIGNAALMPFSVASPPGTRPT
jgi:hypothetical protein